MSMATVRIGARHLKLVIKSIKDLMTNVKIVLSKTKITLEGRDVNNGVAFCCNIPVFSSFSAGEDFSHTFWVNPHTMWKILGCADDEDLITINPDIRANVVYFKSINRRVEVMTYFVIKLPDVMEEESGPVQLEGLVSPAELQMSAEYLHGIFKKFKEFSQKVMITINKDQIEFSTTGGEEIGSASIMVMPRAAVTEVTMPLSLTFSTRLLVACTEGLADSGVVTLKLTQAKSMVVEYVIAQGVYLFISIDS